MWVGLPLKPWWFCLGPSAMQSSPFTATISSPATVGCDLSLFRSVSPSFSTQNWQFPTQKNAIGNPPLEESWSVGVYRTVRPTSRFHHVSSQWLPMAGESKFTDKPVSINPCFWPCQHKEIGSVPCPHPKSLCFVGGLSLGCQISFNFQRFCFVKKIGDWKMWPFE